MLLFFSSERRQLERERQAYEERVAHVLARLTEERRELAAQEQELQARRRRLVEVGHKLRRRWLREKQRMQKTVVAANVKSLRWQERLQGQAIAQARETQRLGALMKECDDSRAGLTILMK